MSETIIQIQKVTKSFNTQEKALDQITTNIHAGCVTGLVGPDGAGKTTLIRLMTGLMRPTQGKVMVCGFDSVTQSANIQDILGYMPQKFGLYEDLTVLENLNLYARLRGVPKQEKEITFNKMLAFSALAPFRSRIAGKLSGGMKQKLGLACALLSHPKVLLLDEPSVGVDPISRRELWKMVQELATTGIAIVWSTSYLDEAELCQEVILLNEGKILFNGEPRDLTAEVQDQVFKFTPPLGQLRTSLSQILKQPHVLDGIIQGSQIRVLLDKEAQKDPNINFTPIHPRFEDAFIAILRGKYSRHSILASELSHKSTEKTDPIVAIELTKNFGDFVAAKDISFTIKRGEIFGLLGPNGAGKSTTFKMLCGLLQPTKGKALVSGFDLKTAGSVARSHIGYMAQKFSLYGDLSVKQNLEFFSGIYGLKGKGRSKKIAQMIEVFDFERYLQVNSGILPLGFKQRLALSCAMMHEPDVLFLDEPTSGVDPLTRREFWTHINGMVEKGVTIMITTHFMDEAEYCDRIALIYKGKNIATDTPDGLKARIKDQVADPTLEEAFIELIRRSDLDNGTQ